MASSLADIRIMDIRCNTCKNQHAGKVLYEVWERSGGCSPDSTSLGNYILFGGIYLKKEEGKWIEIEDISDWYEFYPSRYPRTYKFTCDACNGRRRHSAYWRHPKVQEWFALRVARLERSRGQRAKALGQAKENVKGTEEAIKDFVRVSSELGMSERELQRGARALQ